MMRHNPLVWQAWNRRQVLSTAAILVTVVAAWGGMLFMLDSLRFTLIRGTLWVVLSWLMLFVWFFPAVSFIIAVQRARMAVQQDVYQVLNTTTMTAQQIVLGYTAQTLFSLRWMLLASPLLTVMAGTYPSIFGGEIIVPIDLLPLTITWLLLHTTAVVVATWAIFTWGEHSAIYLLAALVTGMALTGLGLARDRFAFQNMTYACPVHIDTAPIPWLWVNVGGAAAAVALLMWQPKLGARWRMLLFSGLLASIVITSGSSGWLRNWQRYLERQALNAIEATNFTVRREGNDWASPIDHCRWPGIQCECGHVQWVDLRERGITGVLPTEIKHLHYAQYLKLRNNDLNGFPPQLVQMRNLKEISAVDNNITALPAQIGRLDNMTTLELHVNAIQQLPPSIGHMHSLVLLDVSNNDLQTIPPSIGRMPSLELLNVSSNNLTELPPEIAAIETLHTIRANFNQLETLPPGIGQVERLQDLSINDNQLTSLPAEMGQLQALRYVSASNNNLTSVPSELIDIAALEGILLFGNPLKTLPANACLFDGLDVDQAAYLRACAE